tara:strand:+ start:46 stop:183 length:138 start_codon:yes stop_codon:yes gene_type:complete
VKFTKHQKNLILYCLEQQQFEFNQEEIKDMNKIIKTLEIKENNKK